MKTSTVILLILFVGVILSKFYLVQLTDYPAYDAYYSIRQVQHIKDTGVPLINDQLSYQGRSTFSNPLSYYVFALLSVFIPITLLFKFGGILLSLIALYLVYQISLDLYKKPWLSLILVVLAILNPTLFSAYLNTLVPSSLFLILFLFLLSAFLKGNHTTFVVLSILTALTSPLALVLVLGFFIYFLLLKLEALKIKKTEFELLFFSSIFIIWFNLISYKKLLFNFGSRSIWQSIPYELQSSIFSQLNISQTLGLVGIVPLALGIYGIYSSLFEKRNRQVLFINSFAIAFGFLTWLGFIPFVEGLIFIILSFVLVSGHSLLQIQSFFEKTVTPWMSKTVIITAVVISIIGFTTLFIYQDNFASLSPTQDEIDTALALSKYVPKGQTIISHIKEGHLISALANRKNFFDEHFILAPQSQQRYDDAKTIFLSQSQTNVLSLLQNYDVDYVWISSLTKQTYPSTSSLFETSECFDLIYSTETTEVYKVQCVLKG